MSCVYTFLAKYCKKAEGSIVTKTVQRFTVQILAWLGQLDSFGVLGSDLFYNVYISFALIFIF